MSWVIVIEDNPALLAEITEALQQVDPKITLVSFPGAKDFSQWITQLLNKEQAVLDKIPKEQFRGIITDIAGWNFKDLQLIEKFRPIFVKMGFAPSEEGLCVILTGYEAPQHTRFEHRAVTNFIYKPFDKLLLKQKLEIAFAGMAPVKKFHVHNFKTTAQIEMLKEIRLSEITEIGFMTISDQDVAPGKIAKYYADFLETNQHRSALAKAVRSQEIAGTKSYRIEMGFFALDQQQSFNLQKMIQARKTTRPLRGQAPSGAGYEFYFVKDDRGGLCQQIQPSVERFFDHPCWTVNDLNQLGQMLGSNSNTGRKKLIILDSRHVPPGDNSLFQTLAQQAPGAGVYLLSPRIYPEAEELALSALCEDIFYSPFNKSYVIKTIKRRWPDLVTKEELFENHGESDQIIHVSNPVKLVEVSEAGLVLEYYRALPPGTFRSFIFWMPNEVLIPELVGQCTYTEFNKETKTHLCHFVFFGQQDAQQKHIRLWIRQHYIEDKTKE